MKMLVSLILLTLGMNSYSATSPLPNFWENSVDYTDAETLLIKTTNGPLLVSYDNGNSFKVKTFGPNRKVKAIASINDQIFVATYIKESEKAYSYQLYFSKDEGKTFDKLSMPKGFQLKRLVAGHDDHLYLGGQKSANDEHIEIYKMSPSTKSFSLIKIPRALSPYQDGEITDLDVTEDGHIFAKIDWRNLAISRDNGQSFEVHNDSNSSLPDKLLWNVTTSRTGDLVYVMGETQTFSVSYDQGKTFEMHRGQWNGMASARNSAVKFYENGRKITMGTYCGYFCDGFQGIIVSHDRAESFKEYPLIDEGKNLSSVDHIMMSNNSIIALIADGRIFRSEGKGLPFKKIDYTTDF